ALTDRPRGESVRSIDFAEHADEGGILRRQRNHHLRVDGAILDLLDDFLLDLYRGAALDAHRAGIWYRDVAVGVDRLIGKLHEVARAHAGLGRNEQAACRSLEDRDADDIADAK